jgi:hypothetical protein
MNNKMRDKRTAIKIQIGVVQIMSLFCIIVVESLVNSLVVVTSCCVVEGSSVVASPEPRNIYKSTIIDILLELYILKIA